jgi:hypothetical protein
MLFFFAGRRAYCIIVMATSMVRSRRQILRPDLNSSESANVVRWVMNITCQLHIGRRSWRVSSCQERTSSGAGIVLGMGAHQDVDRGAEDLLGRCAKKTFSLRGRSREEVRDRMGLEWLRALRMVVGSQPADSGERPRCPPGSLSSACRGDPPSRAGRSGLEDTGPSASLEHARARQNP